MSDFEYVFVLNVKMQVTEYGSFANSEYVEYVPTEEEMKIPSKDFVVNHVEEDGEVDYDGLYILKELEQKKGRTLLVTSANLIRKKVFKTSIKKMYLNSN